MILSIKMNKVLITGAHGQDGIILSKILLKLISNIQLVFNI
jgi:GDP-D-mannose dehydratase